MTKERRIYLNSEGNYIDLRYNGQNVTYVLDPRISFLKGLIRLQRINEGYSIYILNKRICDLIKKEVVPISEITSTELRCIYEMINNQSENENIKNIAALNRPSKIQFVETELHTHLIEMLSGKDFLLFLKKFNVKVPISNGKLDFMSYESYRIEDIDEKTLRNIESQISLTLEGKSSFNELLHANEMRRCLLSICKDCYASMTNRDKDDLCVQDEIIHLLLRESLIDLAQKGVTYAEISYSNIRTLKYLVTQDYSDIPISFKLLKSIDRTDTAKSYRQAMSDNHIALYNNQMIAGIDIMGSEEPLDAFDFLNTSSKREDKDRQYSFYYKLAQLVPKLNKIPKSILRMHAGEFVDSSENVENSLQILDNLVTEQALHLPPPQIRIGHGINIVRRPTLINLLKKYNCIIEFNISSNYALDHVTDLTQLPIKYYIDNGIRYVIATDGAGMYRTNAHQEEQILTSLERRDTSYIKTELQVRGLL